MSRVLLVLFTTVCLESWHWTGESSLSFSTWLFTLVWEQLFIWLLFAAVVYNWRKTIIAISVETAHIIVQVHYDLLQKKSGYQFERKEQAHANIQSLLQS